MRDASGSLPGRAVLAACLFFSLARPAAAQQPLGIVTAPDSPQFLSRFDFNVSAARLGHPDQRFSWDTHWATDFDMVDYVFGRVSFLADYQALLGSEFRAFDPYQSNYTLEASGSYRRNGTEFLGVLSHVSRHLGDRFKRVAVAENSLGPRVMHRFEGGTRTLEIRADLRKIIAKAYVDYTWISSAHVGVEQRLSPRTTLYLRGFGQAIAVDETIAARGGQAGGRIEAGIRIAGSGGRIELFGGGERIIDADQLDRLARRWAFFGFRLLQR